MIPLVIGAKIVPGKDYDTNEHGNGNIGQIGKVIEIFRGIDSSYNAVIL